MPDYQSDMNASKVQKALRIGKGIEDADHFYEFKNF